MNGSYKRKILTSVLAIAVSVGMICSGTYAWFMAEAVNAGNVIRTASYSLQVELSNANEDTISKDGESDSYIVNAAGTYTFVLEVDEGDSTGYCVITVTKTGEDAGEESSTKTSEKYRTEQIAAGNEKKTISLTVHMDAAGSISFKTVWGPYTEKEGEAIKQLTATENAYIIGEPPTTLSILSSSKPGNDTTADTPSDGNGSADGDDVGKDGGDVGKDGDDAAGKDGDDAGKDGDDAGEDGDDAGEDGDDAGKDGDDAGGDTDGDIPAGDPTPDDGSAGE